VNYIHDFETQTGETFEGSVIGYDAQATEPAPPLQAITGSATLP
jgi:hypothetical protein